MSRATKRFAEKCNTEAAAIRLAQSLAEQAMQPRIDAAREEGRRYGRKLGWFEATAEATEAANRVGKLGRDYLVYTCFAAHLREKADKLP